VHRVAHSGVRERNASLVPFGGELNHGEWPLGLPIVVILLYSPDPDQLEVLIAAISDRLRESVAIKASCDLEEAQHLISGASELRLIVCDGVGELTGAEQLVQAAMCIADRTLVTVVLVDNGLPRAVIASLYQQGTTTVIRQGDSLGVLWSRVAAAGKFWCEIASLP